MLMYIHICYNNILFCNNINLPLNCHLDCCLCYFFPVQGLLLRTVQLSVLCIFRFKNKMDLINHIKILWSLDRSHSSCHYLKQETGTFLYRLEAYVVQINLTNSFNVTLQLRQKSIYMNKILQAYAIYRHTQYVQKNKLISTVF